MKTNPDFKKLKRSLAFGNLERNTIAIFYYHSSSLFGLGNKLWQVEFDLVCGILSLSGIKDSPLIL